LIEGKFNKKTDIWAMGCVFYEVCTGKKAFTSEWATITFAQQPTPTPIFPFIYPFGAPSSQELNIETINQLLADNMLVVNTEKRCDVDLACGYIANIIRDPGWNPPSSMTIEWRDVTAGDGSLGPKWIPKPELKK
jgi:serine/threonine protein kinase